MKNQATKHNFLNFAQGLFRLLQTRMRLFDFHRATARYSVLQN